MQLEILGKISLENKIIHFDRLELTSDCTGRCTLFQKKNYINNGKLWGKGIDSYSNHDDKR